MLNIIAIKVTRLCRTSKSVYADPASINSLADADDGASGAAVSGESVCCVTDGVNTDYSVTWVFSTPTNPNGTCRPSDLRDDVLPKVSGEILVPDRDSFKGGYESKYGLGNTGMQISGSKSDAPEELQISDGHHLRSGPSGYAHREPAGRIGNGGHEDRMSSSCVGGSLSTPETFILDDDVQTDTAAAGRVISASNGERSKVSSPTAGKTKTAVVAGSGVIKKLQSRDWVKTKKDENGSHPCVSNLTQIPAPVGKISFLGLGDKDFPLIRPLSDSGNSRVASELGDGSLKTRAISVAETDNDVTHRSNASDVTGNSKGVRNAPTLSGVAGYMGAFSATKSSDIIKHHGSLSGIGSASTLSGVAGPMGDFSSTKCSDNIEHHGSLIGFGSGDFPPLSPFVKVVLGKQKACPLFGSHYSGKRAHGQPMFKGGNQYLGSLFGSHH